MSTNQLLNPIPVSPTKRPSVAVASDGSRTPAMRLDDVDRAKGLAIALVVLGHLVARDPPQGNEWYVLLKTAIYSFHMPFFMYLSGIIFFHTGNATNPRPDYLTYLRRRAQRLLVPFVLLGLLIVLGKSLASMVFYVDNNPHNISAGILALIWNTNDSPATSIWFIYVLFGYCAVTPILLRIARRYIWPIFALALTVHFLPAPPFAYLDRILWYYVFFVIGLSAGKLYYATVPLIDYLFPASIVLFLAAVCFTAAGNNPVVFAGLSSLLALPALHGLVRTHAISTSKGLLWLGHFAFVIYLVNTLFIGLTKAILLKFMAWDGSNFLLFFSVLTAAGLFGPIALKRFVLQRVGFLDRLTN